MPHGFPNYRWVPDKSKQQLANETKESHPSHMATPTPRRQSSSYTENEDTFSDTDSITMIKMQNEERHQQLKQPRRKHTATISQAEKVRRAARDADKYAYMSIWEALHEGG